MFAITSTRIVGLIAVVCAVAVVPQALAAPSSHSTRAALKVVAPSDAVRGFDLSDFDLSALNDIPGYQGQQEYLRGLARAAFAAGTHKNVKAARFVYKPTNPGWGAAATAAKKPAPKPADKPWSPVLCNGEAEYDYVYNGCSG